MTRRCGVQLPSGKSCPTFLSSEQNVCAKHARAAWERKMLTLDPNEVDRVMRDIQRSKPPLIPPPRRSLSGRIIDWILTKA